MKTKIFLFILVLALVFGLWFKDDIPTFYETLRSKVLQAGQLAKEVEKDISLPPPLRSERDYSDTFLTRSGVINWTNTQRAQNGLPPLTENFRLNNSARMKTDDMFAEQYFEHVSPSGTDVSDLAQNAGYEFVMIGENLALGNFKNDADLVQAWMDSPGHRANILNTRYKEIGVSVVRGIFEGKTTWLAVQHFGLALSTCPEPDSELKKTLTEYDSRIDTMRVQLDTLKNEMAEAKRPRDNDAYNQKVDEYNVLVKEYNALLDELKNLTLKYNSQVSVFNRCVSGD